MKSYILALVVLFSLAAPAMAAELTANQIPYTEMWVNGTGFTQGAEVTLSTSTIIPVTSSGSAYSYEMTGMYLPAGSVLTLDASPVKGDLNIHVKKYWPLVRNYKYPADPTGTVHVKRSIPSWIAGTFQTIRVYGTARDPDVVVNLSVTVQQDVTADESGSFSEKVDISAIPAGNYTIIATDAHNTAANNTTIYAPGQLHHITITNPDASERTLNTTEDYQFNATGYDLGGKVVQNVAFDWWSSNTYVGTIDSTGYFEADKAGNTEVYARSGAKESNHVIVYVNAPTVSGDVKGGSGNATSGNSTADVTLNDTSVSGTVNITEIGDPTNGTNKANLGLSSGNQLVKGAVVNASPSILDALDADAVNETSWVQIRVEYDPSVITSRNIDESTLDIWKYNVTTHAWELVKNQPYCLESGRDMAANYIWVNVTHLCSYALVGATIPSSSGGGGDGTYPPGWFGTPTPAPTAAPTSTPPPGVTPAPAGGEVTPTAKPAAAGVAPTAPVKETPAKKDIPGFTAVFAIAGLLAIAYVVMRRHR